jgi:hypothetical protein
MTSLDVLLERRSREETDAIAGFPTKQSYTREELDSLTHHTNQKDGCWKRDRKKRGPK